MLPELRDGRRRRRAIVRGVRRPGYRWLIVATLCVTETITWGIAYYGFAVFLPPMEQALGGTRVAITGAFSVAMGVMALAALPVGRWIDRFGSRALMTVGSCAVTALMFAWSRVESLAGLYVVWVLMGLALATTLYEPAFATVVAWFTRDRERALTIVTLVAGLASTIFMPLESVLLERLGWRPALGTLAIFLGATTVPLHALILRAPPRAVTPPHAAAVTVSDVTLRSAARQPIFWMLMVAFHVSNFAAVAVTVHVIPFLVERGYAPATAAAVVGWIGATQLLGRMFFAPISGRMGARAITASIFFLQAGGLVALAFLWPALVPIIVLLGVSNGMSTLARATNVAEIFGRRHYATIAGAVALGANGGRAFGPVGASLLRAGLGGYPAMFETLAAALIVVGVGVLATRASAASEEVIEQA